MQFESVRQAAQHGAEIYTTDEAAVLTEFFSHKGRRTRGQSRLRAVPGLIEEYPELAEKVASIALEVVQARLPQWGAVRQDGTVVLGRKVKQPRARRVVAAPRHMLTINWADSGPGFSWPEAYHATPIPGFDKYVVTASRDSEDAWGCCDHAIGWFDIQSDWKQGARAIIEAWWKWKRGYEQGRWIEIWDSGSLGEADALALREAIWPDEQCDGEDSEESRELKP